MAYTYGIKNVYRPSALAPNAYGWSTRPQYNRADVPTGLMTRTPDMSSDALLQQFAYEWFQSGDLNFNFSLTNPPFLSGASGRLHPLLRDAETGKPARILRGYIRRAEFEAGDVMSKARLGFMYNPENITRDYVSYLNQAALDPFNSVYQSENLVAPPSYMDFSFSLFFDRQEEAMQDDHPGVFVDYQYFDMVVRNVVPSDPNQTGNTLPDNGIMMVNPRDITVVFSPQLTVQGRPLNASVNFEKFTHRMTPTRMTINLSIRVIYMGPVKDQVEYKKEQLQAEAQISLADEIKPLDLTWLSNENDTEDYLRDLIQRAAETTPSTPMPPGSTALLHGTANDANHQVRMDALNWAIANVNQGGPGEGPWTDYEDKDSGPKRHDLPNSADCSGLVVEAYKRTGNAEAMKWTSHFGSSELIRLAEKNTTLQMFVPFSSINMITDLLPGDILIGHGHVAFFVGYEGNRLRVFDAYSKRHNPEVGERPQPISNKIGKLTHLLRPTPIGASSLAGNSSYWQNRNSGAYGAGPLLPTPGRPFT